jgi:hypothetical protein
VLSVAGPASVVAVFVVSALLGIWHGAQPGPVTRISAPPAKKPDPVIVKVNGPAVVGGSVSWSGW